MQPQFKIVTVYHDGQPVADVRVDADLDAKAQLEQAWRATQNIDGSWSQGQYFADGTCNRDFNPFVTVLAPLHVHQGRTYGLRSSMVGDVFRIVGAGSYRVASFGFEQE